MDRVGADSSQRSLANELRRLEEGKLGLGLHETQPPVSIRDPWNQYLNQKAYLYRAIRFSMLKMLLTS